MMEGYQCIPQYVLLLLLLLLLRKSPWMNLGLLFSTIQ